ncbi:MAG: hypothetical protein JNN01_00255 [Opitutaceae bacterium]|nr:hypothetical protein [Opitutaceae bacterium]
MAAALLFSSCATAPSGKELPLEMSVSSANYVTSSKKALIKSLNARDNLNPPIASTPLVPLAEPKTYLFFPGETFPSDLTFEQVCERLVNPLARKKYLNYGLERESGRSVPREPEMVLRISYGQRTWRLGQIRLENLAWKDGLVPGHGSGHAPGGTVVWDARAGGDDTVLYDLDRIMREKAESQNRSGDSPPSSQSDFASLAQREPTQEHFIVVIDAFNLADIKQKGVKAERVWTTFIALPVRGQQKLSDVLASMLRVATPYFGETTTGMQRFDDARVEVLVGTPEVVSESATPQPETPKPE